MLICNFPSPPVNAVSDDDELDCDMDCEPAWWLAFKLLLLLLCTLPGLPWMSGCVVLLDDAPPGCLVFSVCVFALNEYVVAAVGLVGVWMPDAVLLRLQVPNGEAPPPAFDDCADTEGYKGGIAPENDGKVAVNAEGLVGVELCDEV